MIRIEDIYTIKSDSDGLFCTSAAATALSGRTLDYIDDYMSYKTNIDRMIVRLNGNWAITGTYSYDKDVTSDLTDALTLWNEEILDWHMFHGANLQKMYEDIFADFPGGPAGYRKKIREVKGDLKKEAGTEKTTTTPSGTETRTLAKTGSETDTLTKSGSEQNQTVSAIKTDTASTATFDSASYVGKDKEVSDGFTDTDTLSFTNRQDQRVNTFTNRQDTDTLTFTNRKTEEEKTYTGRATSADYTDTTTEQYSEDLYADMIRDIENRIQFDFYPMMIKWILHDLAY